MGVSSQFIIDFFKERTSAPVCIASYANLKEEAKQYPPVELYTRDPRAIERFVEKHDMAGRAVYFGVNTVVQGKTRGKPNVAEIDALNADLDFSSIVENRKQIEAVLARLPLAASLIVFSGNGLHGYWWTSASPGEKERVERLLKRLAWALAGDEKVTHIAAVMRLPGSHNTKRGEKKPVEVVARNDALYELDQLEEWLASIDEPLLHRKGEASKANGKGNIYEQAGEAQIRREPIDVDAMWDELQYLGTGGGGNVHATQLSIGAALLNRGIAVDAVIEHIREEIIARIPESSKWNWDTEMRDLRGQCVGFFVKDPQLLELQENAPRWLLRNSRIKPLIEEPEEEGEAPKVKEPPKATPPLLKALFAEELEQRPLLKREWIVEDFILAYQLNGLFGDGGMGKDLILLQLAIAMSTGQQWLGQDVLQGKVLYFPVEDDLDELKRRQYAINKHYGIDASEHPKRLKIVPMIGEETVLAVFDGKSGLVKPTPLYEAVVKEVEEFGPLLTIVGNRVNIFGVNQNEDAQARQCLGLLSRLCVHHRTTVIMPGHVSLRGQSAGDGTSGSVQWSNGVRSRCYLRYPEKEDKDEKPDTSRRELEVMKINYAPTGNVIAMQWTPVEEDGHSLGVYATDAVAVTKPKPENGETESQMKKRVEKETHEGDDAEWLRTLDRHFKVGSYVSAAPTAHTYAPTIFSRDEDCKLKGKANKKRLQAAMGRLFARKVIHSVKWGFKSDGKMRIERVGLKVVE